LPLKLTFMAEVKAHSISQRLEQLDWSGLEELLDERGFALTPPLLCSQECSQLAALFSSEEAFRSHIVMARYRFGRGHYKYFDYPLPPMVQQLRERSYGYLVEVANQWNQNLRVEKRFPASHSAFLRMCKKHGQKRATPLLLHYEKGDFNCLHQDIYGDVAFPMQMTCFLSRPGVDYEGGEFVLVEQQPRAQSRAEVVVAEQGQILIFATRYRPVKGSRGYYRVNLRHGVSSLKSGSRFTLGIIFHDSK
jgi:uncharacterized protein